MSKSIRLSPKHGVNPAIPICFFCAEPKNEIILAGRLLGDAEAPSKVAWDRTPCDQCTAMMKQGVVFLSVRDGETGENPYRTGRLAVLRDEAVERIVNDPKLASSILEKRVCFLEDKTWIALGLPT